MTRLSAAIQGDVRLQFRNGFYYASAFVMVVSIIILSQLPLSQEILALLLPPILMQNVAINTFYFMAGLVLLEKGEGILEGLVVSPLRRGEYLISKAVTLALLSVVESLGITIVLYGLGFNIFFLAVSIILLGLFLTLLGFVAVSRYESINTFLLPSVVMLMVISVPLLDYFKLWPPNQIGLGLSWLIYLHPIHALLLLMKAAFEPIAAWQLGYGLFYSLAWIGLTYRWCKGAFYHFVILKEGVR